MATYLMLTRVSDAEQLDLREAMMEVWPTLVWHGAPIVLANGEQVTVFSAPPQCTLEHARQLLRLQGIRHGEVFPAPAWAHVYEHQPGA